MDGDTSPGLLPGRVVGGAYRLEAPIGRGGYGAVYRARAVGDERIVAVKVLSRAEDAHRRQRFAREARLACQLRHPNLVRTLDVGEDPDLGCPFMVFEFVAGVTLGALVNRSGGLPERRAAALLAQVATGLAEAHRLGIVHRDVKPENIMVSPPEHQPHVTLLDFGAARGADGISAPLTALGSLLGTPQFMSPEQAAGGVAQPASDLYALGATAYFALSGQPPFAGRPLGELLQAHLTAPPPPLPAALTDGQPPSAALQALLDALLAKGPLARPIRADVAARLFQALARGEQPDVAEVLLEARRQAFAASLPAGQSLATNPLGQPAVSAPASAPTPAAPPPAAPEPTPVPLDAARRQLLMGQTLETTGGAPEAWLAPPLPPRRRLSFNAALGVGLALLVGLVIALVLATPEQPVETVPPPAEPVAAQLALPVPTPRQAVELVSTPPDAEVYVLGELRGRTPMTLELEGLGAPRAVLRKKGYQEQNVALRAGQVQVLLPRVASPKPEPRPAVPTPDAPKADEDGARRFDTW